jgi:acyl dehydratase
MTSLPAQDDELSYDASVVGVEVETGRSDVTREQILAFCEAIGDTNPLFTDEVFAKNGPYGSIIAPPAFYTSIRTGGGLDPKLVYGNLQLNSGQHWQYLAPVRPGDSITAKTKVHEIYEKTGRTGRMVFLVRRTTYRNQKDETVAIADNSIVYRKVERQE